MGTQSQDWSIRGAVSTDLTDCAVPWDCVDISERTRNVGDRTFTYCGVGRNAKLLAVAPAQRTPGTGTIVGPDEEVLDIVEEFEGTSCSLYFQLVHCEGEVRHYSGVFLGNRSSQNALTASGPNATAGALIDNVSFQFDRITRIKKATDTNVSQYVTNTGYNEAVAVFGSVDGINTAYTLSREPLSPYPVIVYVDGVETTAFTLVGKTIVMDVAPACGEVVTATYYDERYAIHGTTPLSVMFCGGGECTSGCGQCEDVYALYESTVAADPDTCGTIAGNIAAIGHWAYRGGNLTLVGINTYKNVVDPVDAACDDDGGITIIAANGIFEGGFSGFGIVNPATLPAGATYQDISSDSETGNMYVLFNTSGVLRRAPSGAWATILDDNSMTSVQQCCVASGSGTVMTVGLSNTVQISDSFGSSWKEIDGPGNANTNLIGADIGRTSDPADSAVFIGVMGADTVVGTTSFFVTGDHGLTWSPARKTWDSVPLNPVSVNIFEDWLVYIQFEDETWRNANRGCDKRGAWEVILDSGYATSEASFCGDNPNAIAVFARPEFGALTLRGAAVGTIATVTQFDVVSNLYDDTCALPTYTVVVDDFRFESGLAVGPNIDVTTNIDGFTIDVTMVATVPAGEVLYTAYTATSSCGNAIKGTLIVDVTA